MSKYIDVEKLKEKIKSFSATEYSNNTLGDDVANGVLDYVLEEIIPSLQQEQPEVDLEKEITEHAINMPHGEFTHDSECREHEEWAMKEFRHFYELGRLSNK